MGHCSKEWLKHDFELPEDVILERLLTEEIYGLYLIGVISEGKFREVTGISFDNFNKMNAEIRNLLNKYGAKHDKKIEIIMW
ncbi:hypothetical protein AXJ14_gp132 [Geobacillus virus E3]|uniref:hypothetical protein n=1 Tax=Geobacillus virus E3 TaxID=1572712 RepID=UPI000671BD24|nr:hypothetical protein AXJ14_gp132 [Geobacillus virus E3]AJA41451.1 hypothetical protein E3_0132 [Geobacillus virus E3]